MAANGGSRFVNLSESQFNELETDIFKENTVRTKSQFVALFQTFLKEN